MSNCSETNQSTIQVAKKRNTGIADNAVDLKNPKSRFSTHRRTGAVRISAISIEPIASLNMLVIVALNISWIAKNTAEIATRIPMHISVLMGLIL